VSDKATNKVEVFSTHCPDASAALMGVNSEDMPELTAMEELKADEQEVVFPLIGSGVVW
jgi:hypothetical protein